MAILEQITEPDLGKPGWNPKFKAVLDRVNLMPEIVLDILAQKIIAGSGISVNYNSATKSFTFSGTGTGGLDNEAMMDYLAANLTVNAATGTYDDPAGTLDFTVAGGGGGGPVAIADVTGLQAALDAKVTAVTAGLKLWKGTQAEYDAIGTKDNNTLYAITS